MNLRRWCLAGRRALAAVVAGWAAASAAAPPLPEGRLALAHQGQERHYLLRLPAQAIMDDTRLPLVLVLHGGGGHAENAEAMTGFTMLARREGFIVAYPEGTGRFRNRLLTWSAGHCCGRAMQQRVDDVGFIRALIDRLLASHPVDPRRIYVTGLSNGGMMTHRLGIELSDRLAAIAPVIATVFGDERRPAHPVPALMINGQLDASVPAAGGPPGGRFTEAWDGTPTLPSLAQGRFWAAANGCAGEPEASVQGAVQRTRWRCPAGREVEVLLVADNGHAWPGGQSGSRRADPPSKALNANEAIWAFFKAHAR